MKRLNRYVASQLLAVYVIGVCGLAHLQASNRLEYNHPDLTLASVKGARRIAIVEFIHSNWWVILPYLAVWFAFLLWMEIRSSPPWAVWATFCALGFPCVAYAWGCWNITVL